MTFVSQISPKRLVNLFFKLWQKTLLNESFKTSPHLSRLKQNWGSWPNIYTCLTCQVISGRTACQKNLKIFEKGLVDEIYLRYPPSTLDEHHVSLQSHFCFGFRQTKQFILNQQRLPGQIHSTRLCIYTQSRYRKIIVALWPLYTSQLSNDYKFTQETSFQ